MLRSCVSHPAVAAIPSAAMIDSAVRLFADGCVEVGTGDYLLMKGVR